MLSSTQTKLSPDEVIALAYDYFVGKHGLVPIEQAKHLHGAGGTVAISVPGSAAGGPNSPDSHAVFSQLTYYAQTRHRLTPVHALLHLRAPRDDDTRQLLVQASFGEPVEVRVETRHYAFQAREFMASLPR